MGKSPEAQINDQIKKIDKKLAEDAKRQGQEPPPPILPKGSDMTLDEKKEAVRNARAAYLDRLAEQNGGGKPADGEMTLDEKKEAVRNSSAPNLDRLSEQEGGGKPADGEMTIDQKLEAVRNAKSSITEKNSDELSQRPSEPPAEQPSESSPKKQFAITTEVVEEKPERPELVEDSPAVTRTPSPHPWKVVPTSSGSVNIAEGYIMGYYTQYQYDAWGEVTPSLLAGPLSAYAVVLAAGYYFSGGNIPVTGSKFIYAEVPISNPPLVYSEARADVSPSYVEAELGDKTRPPDYTADPFEVSGVPYIVLSDSPPHTYISATGKAAVCIAKATNVDGVISVKQYFTHNPTVFFPVINLLGGGGEESPP